MDVFLFCVNLHQIELHLLLMKINILAQVKVQFLLWTFSQITNICMLMSPDVFVRVAQN